MELPDDLTETQRETVQKIIKQTTTWHSDNPEKIEVLQTSREKEIFIHGLPSTEFRNHELEDFNITALEFFGGDEGRIGAGYIEIEKHGDTYNIFLKEW